jgi:hypothetical protein
MPLGKAKPDVSSHSRLPPICGWNPLATLSDNTYMVSSTWFMATVRVGEAECSRALSP